MPTASRRKAPEQPRPGYARADVHEQSPDEGNDKAAQSMNHRGDAARMHL